MFFTCIFRQHSVLRSDTAFVELKCLTRSCPLFVDDFLSHKRELPDHCTSSRKFQGHCRMCPYGCALISVAGSRRNHILVRTVRALEQQNVTSNKPSSLSTTRIWSLFVSDVPCKTKNPDSCTSNRKRHLRYRKCPPSSATSLHMSLSCIRKECLQEDLRHQRTVSVEPSHKFMH